MNLNTDKLNLSDTALKVAITDLDTGISEQRTSSLDGLYTTPFWGQYISFAPPTLKPGTSSYAGKRYKIVLTNLTDAEKAPIKLVYSVHFFIYVGSHVIDGVTYQLDEHGKSFVKVSKITLSGISKKIAAGKKIELSAKVIWDS